MPDVSLYNGYHPDRDPDILLLRITQRRAELARWQVIARRWWAALAALSGLFTTLVLLGAADYVQVIAGVVAVVTAVCQGYWHQGMTRGVELRRAIGEAERELLAAEHRIEVERERHERKLAAQHEAAQHEAAQPEPESVPVTTTRLLVPDPTGKTLFTELTLSEAVTVPWVPRWGPA